MTKQSVMTAMEARVHFGELMRRVRNGEIVTISRRGKPAAVAMPYAFYHELKARKEARESASGSVAESEDDNAMSKRITATEARIHLGAHLDSIDNNGAITVEHEGTPEAVLLSALEAEDLSTVPASVPDWRKCAERSREAFRHQLGDREMPSAVELIREGREERDGLDDQEVWRKSLARVRARMKAELGGKTIDFNQIIHDMREERSAQLLDNLRRRQSRRQPH